MAGMWAGADAGVHLDGLMGAMLLFSSAAAQHDDGGLIFCSEGRRVLRGLEVGKRFQPAKTSV